MAIDGILLHTILNRLQFLQGAKIGKIQNLGAEEYLFHVHSREAGPRKLVINIHSNTNRIYLHSGSVQPAPEPDRFVMALRKYLSQASIASIEQSGFDRILCVKLWAHNEFQDRTTRTLYIELMGKYANLILCDEDDIIIEAAKRIPVYENSQRLIHPGAKYALPEQPDKMNPLEAENLDLEKSLVSQILGFSPLLSREFIYRMKQGEEYRSILEQIFASDTLHYYDDKNFHAIELKHLEKPDREYELMAGLEKLYASSEKKARLETGAKDVLRCVRSQQKRLAKKLPRLQEQLEESREYDRYREYGDLLFAYQDSLQKQPSVELESFETGQPVCIELDPRFSIPENARRCYKKYHKLKRAGELLEEQIRECLEETAYFDQLEEQLKHCDLQDAAEIRSELVSRRYLREKEKRPSRKKKKPNLLHLQLEDAEIWVGKNNLQNQYITHTLGRKQDLWFHVKDYHGSHVLLKCEHPEERHIRMAAMLACWYSKGAQSSSVPVDYTTISQLKKIPGSQPGLVSMKSYKTIYIDPEEETIREWIRTYQKR